MPSFIGCRQEPIYLFFRHTNYLSLPLDAFIGAAAGLLSSRGYNIESIIGWRTENPGIYQIHFVTFGTREQIEQISKQIQKLIDTIKVVNIGSV